MDAFTLSLWVVRLLFVLLLYLFLALVGRSLWRDLRGAAATVGRPLGRLVVVGSTEGGPATGTSFVLDAVNSIGRDVNNSVVVEDTFASAEHALLTFRGRSWYLEDRGSTNGTFLNGERIEGLVPLGYGDEIQVGRVRLRLDRAPGE
ncbi:MAG TPA: FHA domain-containing protein [Candidatus Limnocylindrales bacterium]|nr:FHA domain-containing protein [Candidatus Limnocylindrales bacterium]